MLAGLTAQGTHGGGLAEPVLLGSGRAQPRWCSRAGRVPLQRSRVSAPSPWQVGEWDREAGPRSGEQGSQGHRSLVPCSGSTALPAEPPAPTGVPGLPSPARGQHRIKKT